LRARFLSNPETVVPSIFGDLPKLSFNFNISRSVMLSNKENDFKTRYVKISFQQLINKYLKIELLI